MIKYISSLLISTPIRVSPYSYRLYLLFSISVSLVFLPLSGHYFIFVPSTSFSLSVSFLSLCLFLSPLFHFLFLCLSPLLSMFHAVYLFLALSLSLSLSLLYKLPAECWLCVCLAKYLEHQR